MKDYIEIGSSPCSEDCVQVGQENYTKKARIECALYIELIRKTFGPEPGSAQLRIKANPHDFGTYYEVACYYDSNDEIGAKYAFDCENAPEYWPADMKEELQRKLAA